MNYEIEEVEEENEEALEAIEREVEVYDDSELENMYVESLDCETVMVCGQEFNPSRILEELDPTAYRCGLNDFIDSTQETTTEYTCPICGAEHEDEDDAKWCCQEENITKFEVNGDIYDNEEEAQIQVDFLEEEENEEN